MSSLNARRSRSPYADAPSAALALELRWRGFVVLDPRDGIALPGFVLHANGRTATVDGVEHLLTARERQVLVVLARAWPEALRAAAIQEAVWGHRCPSPSTPHGDAHTYLCCLLRDHPGLIARVGPGLYRLAVPGAG